MSTPQFQEGRHIYRPTFGAEVESDGYHAAMALVAIHDSAQDGDVIAYVPYTQVESLLAHLNGEPVICRHCDRVIVQTGGLWVDPEATGDDVIWRETCDAHDTFTAEHEPGG